MIQKRIINAFSRFSSPVMIFFGGTKTLTLMALTVAWSRRVQDANFTQLYKLYAVYVFLTVLTCLFIAIKPTYTLDIKVLPI